MPRKVEAIGLTLSLPLPLGPLSYPKKKKPKSCCHAAIMPNMHVLDPTPMLQSISNKFRYMKKEKKKKHAANACSPGQNNRNGF